MRGLELNRGNDVLLSGAVLSEPVCSHETAGEQFYRFDLAVRRLSGVLDILPVVMGQGLLAEAPLRVGCRVLVRGQVRSYNRVLDGQNRLVVTVYARSLEPADGVDDANSVNLTGYLCKPAVYRVTPFHREIADLLVVVNRPHGRSDYLPCIAWGSNARACRDLPVGTALELSGRMQSREYIKHLPQGDEARVAYEISVALLKTAMTPAMGRDPALTGG